MNHFLYKHRKIILTSAILLMFSGTLLGYKKWGMEPEETIAGFLCGLGFGIALIYFSIKESKK